MNNNSCLWAFGQHSDVSLKISDYTCTPL